jgi:hypothetical protein
MYGQNTGLKEIFIAERLDSGSNPGVSYTGSGSISSCKQDGNIRLTATARDPGMALAHYLTSLQASTAFYGDNNSNNNISAAFRPRSNYTGLATAAFRLS